MQNQVALIFGFFYRHFGTNNNMIGHPYRGSSTPKHWSSFDEEDEFEDEFKEDAAAAVEEDEEEDNDWVHVIPYLSSWWAMPSKPKKSRFTL